MRLPRYDANVLLPTVVAILLCVLSVGIFVALVWVLGGLNTSGKHLDWTAAGALAAFLTAAAALATLAVLGLNVGQLASNLREERIARLPYLRVDLGFECQRDRQGNFVPPVSRYTFAAEEFRIAGQLGDMEALGPVSMRERHDLVLWITNQQTAPLGAAYDIRLTLFLVWELQGESESKVLDIRFTYIEAGQTTALWILRLRSDVPRLVASVQEVSYESLQRAERLFDRHGATDFVYIGSTGRTWNERAVQLGRHRGQ